MTPLEWIEIASLGLGLVTAAIGGSKLKQVRAARAAKREAVKRARGEK